MSLLNYFLILFLSTSSVHSKFTKYHLSDEYITEINSKQSTWTAGKNFKETDFERIKIISNGALPRQLKDNNIRLVVHDEDSDIPDSFASTVQWPNCDSLKQIRDQSNCGSCWAFASVSAMSDRICIHSNQTLQTLVSAEDLLSCCSVTCGDGCSGGFEAAAWAYWYTNGITTGGLYETDQGCRSYSLPPCEHHTEGNRTQCNDFNEGETFDTPQCVKQCDTDVEGNTYNDSLTFGQEPYAISSLVKQIQLEIMTNGPVTATFDVYADFPNYKRGVYQRTTLEYLGAHVVKIVGWGVEFGVPFWTIVNSWNSDWGDNGYFKIVRGTNECGIESMINAALPLL